MVSLEQMLSHMPEMASGSTASVQVSSRRRVSDARLLALLKSRANCLMFLVVDEAIRLGSNYASLIESIPIGRWGMPEEIAQGVVFLASEKASLITGEELIVDGGFIHSA